MMKVMKVKLRGTIGSNKNRNPNSWMDLEMFYLRGGGGPDSFFFLVISFRIIPRAVLLLEGGSVLVFLRKPIAYKNLVDSSPAGFKRMAEIAENMICFTVYLFKIMIRTHSKSWINEAKRFLSCDKFGYRSRMMFLDKNEVTPFQKCPWNALCKNGILLKIHLFQNQIQRQFFNQTPQQNHFCALNSILML